MFQRPFLRGLYSGGGGLSMEGNLRFKIDWASFIVGRKFTVFALFYLVFEDNFQAQASGGFIFGGAILTKGFLRYEFGGAYILRAYFRNFTVSLMTHANCIGLGTKTFESFGVQLDATDRELNFHAGKTVVNSLKKKLRYDQATAISYQYGVIFEVDFCS